MSQWRDLKEFAEGIEQELKITPVSSDSQDSSGGGFNRREFLQWMGAAVTLMGVEGCTRQPTEKILPYAKAPEEFVPGKPLFYATASLHRGIANGVLVESHMGRPTKVEGNPSHPSSLGGTDLFGQAAILDLYDPDRAQAVLHKGKINAWGNFVNQMRDKMSALQSSGGAGLRILTETITSPSLAGEIHELLAKYPKAQWYQYEPMGRDNVKEGAILAFGSIVDTVYHLDKAERVLSLDANFLTEEPGHIKYAKDFMARRRAEKGPQIASEMNRLYVVETSLTSTGATADHRLAAKPTDLEEIALAFAAALGAGGATNAQAPWLKWVQTTAKDLLNHRGKSVVIVGEGQPAAVHALGHLLNQALGAVGTAVTHHEAIESNPTLHRQSLYQLIREMNAGSVELLCILGGNPVYSVPGDVDFANGLSKVKTKVHLSCYVDETASLCDWHLPQAHYLETWGDARAYDGTATIMQPLIAPLYQGKSALEVVSVLLGKEETGYAIVQNHWKNRLGGGFENQWRKALHDGFIPGTTSAARHVSVKWSTSQWNRPRVNTSSMEIVFRPDPTIWDGRYANNGWLQETPKPITTLTWDNAAVISPQTAATLKVQHRPDERGKSDVIEISDGIRKIEAPVYVLPGHPDDTITITVGYGRAKAGRLGTRRGVNASYLRTLQASRTRTGIQVRKVDKTYHLAATQGHHTMADRDPVKMASIAQFAENPDLFKFHTEKEQRLNPQATGKTEPVTRIADYQWGMAINLSACIGCNACMVACQSENNVPIVGKDQILNGREMHWLRIDSYIDEKGTSPDVHFEPVPCMQCEKAPCEVVCPVGATVHSDEGLNDMAYNRCVGTRYCSNNCPYKVRHFNYFQYNDTKTPQYKMMRNPDVTVRSRGVMEKCTYCVQRINHARIQSEVEGRKIEDGEVVTACQSACPTHAIEFGDISDPNTVVSKWKASSLNYSLLADLGTRPRTTYLAKIKNLNPELEKSHGA